jgi:hypothetical protein
LEATEEQWEMVEVVIKLLLPLKTFLIENMSSPPSEVTITQALKRFEMVREYIHNAFPKIPTHLTSVVAATNRALEQFDKQYNDLSLIEKIAPLATNNRFCHLLVIGAES